MSSFLVFGVNGVGKSTILETAARQQQEVEIYRGSTLLMSALNCDTYRQLEAYNAAEKKLALVDSIGSIAVTCPEDKIRIIDTHLIVCFDSGNEDGDFTTEDMWDASLPEIVTGMVYIRSTAENIRQRREKDNRANVRLRTAMPEKVVHDILVNDRRWKEVRTSTAIVLDNNHTPELAATRLLAFVMGNNKPSLVEAPPTEVSI